MARLFQLFQLKATLLLCMHLMRSATEHLAASKFLNIYLQSSQVACLTNKKHRVYSHAHNSIHILTQTHAHCYEIIFFNGPPNLVTFATSCFCHKFLWLFHLIFYSILMVLVSLEWWNTTWYGRLVMGMYRILFFFPFFLLCK